MKTTDQSHSINLIASACFTRSSYKSQGRYGNKMKIVLIAMLLHRSNRRHEKTKTSKPCEMEVYLYT